MRELAALVSRHAPATRGGGGERQREDEARGRMRGSLGRFHFGLDSLRRLDPASPSSVVSRFDEPAGRTCCTTEFFNRARIDARHRNQ